MATLSTSPEYPVPGRAAKLRFTLTESGANFVRVWLTDAPRGSKHRIKIDQEAFTRDKVYEGQGGPNTELRFEPDIGGAYVFVSQEYTQGAAAHGGSYQDDPDTYQSETAAGGETTLTLYVGKRLTQTLGQQPDTATLVVYVWNDRIRETTFSLHGEKSPAVIDAQTQAARVAALSSSITTELTSLIDKTATAAAGTPSDIIDDLIDQFNAHRTEGTPAHNTNEGDNIIDPSFKDPSGHKGFVVSVNEFLRKLWLHMRNSYKDDSEIGSRAYHAPGGTKKADLGNLPLIESSGSLEEAIKGAADGWRAYEAHRVDTTAHTNADNTNAAAALPDILDIHRHFMDSLRQNSPTAPSTESSAAIILVQTLGFEESPL